MLQDAFQGYCPPSLGCQMTWFWMYSVTKLILLNHTFSRYSNNLSWRPLSVKLTSNFSATEMLWKLFSEQVLSSSLKYLEFGHDLSVLNACHTEELELSESFLTLCFIFRPLVPNVPYIGCLAKILISIEEGILKKKKKIYERRDY